jgi:hypothetical protein
MKAFLLAVLAAAFLPIAAIAQQPIKVGDLFDKGGKKLTKEDLATLVPGATIKGTAPSSPTWNAEQIYKNDGFLTGTAYRKIGAGTTGISGKWSVSDQGQLCTDITNGYGQRFQRCDFYYVLGTSYYLAPTDDRMADLLERNISR